ncbi:MAG: hypothetical protein ACE5IY_09625 [bacterium]
MPSGPVTEERVKEIIERYLSQRIEDVEAVRKSPAGRILIVENEVKNLAEKVDRLDTKVEALGNELRQEMQSLRSELSQEIQSAKNLSLTLFIALLGMMGSIFVKIFFFM